VGDLTKIWCGCAKEKKKSNLVLDMKNEGREDKVREDCDGGVCGRGVCGGNVVYYM